MNHKSHNGLLSRFALFAIFLTASLCAISNAAAGEVTLEWDPNQEPDLAGYRLHYGPASGVYEQTIDVGQRTEATISDLSSGGTYFFAVTAYNTAGLESSHSNEVFTTIASPVANPPSVSLITPVSGSTHAKQSQVILSASASDSDGTIVRVEFFVNGKKVGEDVAAPYEIAWSSKNTGVFTVLARAADDSGLVTDSATASIEITGAGKGNGGGTGGGGKPGGGKVSYAAATYSALVPATDSEAAYAASVSVTTTESGSYTGKVKHGGVTYSVKGRLDANGKASHQIQRKGASPLLLTIDASSPEAGQLAGALQDENGPAEFLAKPGSGKSSQAQRNSGRWSVLLPVQEPSELEAPYPRGTGIATLVITRKGVARISGTLADGTVFSQGGQLTVDGELLVFTPLYGKRGLLAGSVVFPTADSEIAAGGHVKWSKPASSERKKLYPAGFQLTLNVVGEAVGNASVPAARSAKVRIPVTSSQELTLFEGGLSEPVVRTFTPSQSPAPQMLAGQERLKISLRKDGRFSGSFDDTGKNTRRRFVGAYLPMHNVGAGFFLGDNEAGGVILEPAR